jgi:hypothetical protein
MLSGGCDPAPTADEVQADIEAANYCAAAGECVNLGSHCPFGCYVLVNQAEVSDITDRIAEYDESNEGTQCTYSCVAVDGFDCTDGRCVVRPSR